MIRLASSSGYSHTQIVVRGSPDPIRRRLDFQVLEVGSRIRIARFSTLGYDAFRVDRPCAPKGQDQAIWGEAARGGRGGAGGDAPGAQAGPLPGVEATALPDRRRGLAGTAHSWRPAPGLLGHVGDAA